MRRYTAAAMVLLVMALAGCTSRTPLVYDTQLRTATFEAYHGWLVKRYPDAHEAGIDAPEFHDKWKHAVVNAESITAYNHALARMCAAVNDPHLVLRPNYALWQAHDGPLGASDLCVKQVNDRSVLWNRGHDLLRSTGKPLSAHEQELDGWTVESFNGAPLRNEPLHTVLNIGPYRSKLTVMLRSPIDGKQRKLNRRRGLRAEVDETGHLKIPFRRFTVRSQAESLNQAVIETWANDTDTSDSTQGAYCSAWRLDNVGIFVWNARKHLPKSGDELNELRTDLAAAAQVLAPTTCALIDLRFMGGGHPRGFELAMQYLLSGELTMTLRRNDPSRPSSLERRIRGLSSCINGPTVILVNEMTASYGEWMAALLRRDLDAFIVGAQTRGAEYCIVSIEGPDGSTLRFGGDPFQRFDDVPPFQSVGITPDVIVAADCSLLIEQPVRQTLKATHEKQWHVAWALLGELCSGQ